MMTIYVKELCPYCKKVLRKADTLGLEEGEDYETKDIADDAVREELIEKGGKRQVPFLIDGETRMYESDDINAYLEAQHG